MTTHTRRTHSMNLIWVAALLASTLAFGAGARAQGAAASDAQSETGLAAVYTDALDGHVTASGKVYDKTKLTAAHKTLPFGTKVRVTNVKNGKTVDLMITDRGPVQKGRILDLSRAAAATLGIPASVMREVTLEVITLGKGR